MDDHFDIRFGESALLRYLFIVHRSLQRKLHDLSGLFIQIIDHRKQARGNVVHHGGMTRVRFLFFQRFSIGIISL